MEQKIIGDEWTLEGTEVAVTLRIDRPDHGSFEIVRADCGRVTTTTYGAGGEISQRDVAEVDASGAFAVTRYGRTADARSRIEPISLERRVNVYGAATELADYGHGSTVELVYDDDSRLRHVVMVGPWGSQEFTLNTDGSRSLAWKTALHSGRRAWDARGRTAAEEVRYET